MNQVEPLAFPFPVLQCSMGDKNEERLEGGAPPEPAMVMNPWHPGPTSNSMGYYSNSGEGLYVPKSLRGAPDSIVSASVC